MSAISEGGKTALLIVDAQYGFMPGGELPVTDGDQVVPFILDLARSGGIDYVLATQDWHPVGHVSFADEPDYRDTWPVHCVQGTRSAELHELIAELDPIVFRKADHIDQDSYSGFGNPDLEPWLRAHEVTELLVVGLATDYCVLNTAMDANRLGFRTTVLLEGVRGVAPHTSEAALEQMALAGIELR
jgi:nicotinamidase/pyrazinamidase